MARRETHYVACDCMVGHIAFEPATDTRVYLEHLENPRRPEFEKICRFGSKNGWVVRDTVNHVICCQSYSTIVAMKVGDGAVDFGRWSNSTTRHQSCFSDWCSEHPDAE